MTLRIGITGAAGQLGFVCAARLAHHHGFEVIPATRAEFSETASLDTFVGGCDAIVHLAGVNRAPDEEIKEQNPGLARMLAEACARAGSRAGIVYSNSIHRDRDDAYGRSKRAAADILRAHCEAAGTAFTEIVFPNLFGEFSRPDYNNFVGTFCAQMARGEPPSVTGDNEVELLHYVDASDVIASAVAGANAGEIHPAGTRASVGAVAARLSRFRSEYSEGVIPDLREAFDRDLFNTYRSYLPDDIWPFPLTRHADARGSFFECVRSQNAGQTSFSTSHPGVRRGDHFHFRKIERFAVVSGKARISVRRLNAQETRTYDVDGDTPCFVDMRTFHTHNIVNTGDDELLTLFWTNELFDPVAPDTYPEPV